jgi:Ulp1 family protease
MKVHTSKIKFQIFVPINIQETHWYLGVINAKKRQIQILDSTGTAFDRTHLKQDVSNLIRIASLLCIHILLRRP